MINDSTYYPTPLEDFADSEQKLIAMVRMDEYIEQNYMSGGINKGVPIDSSAVRTRAERIAYCRALWNNDMDGSRYDYLYNKIEKNVSSQNGIDDILTMEMPAKVRHIPIVRPKLQSLISKEQSRPMISRVIGVDLDILDKKLDKMRDDVLSKQMDKINQKRQAQAAQQQLIQAQQQMMQEMAQDPSAQQTIMMMQAEIEKLQEVLNRDIVITQKEVKTIDEYYKYTHKEFEESLCSRALDEYIDSQRIRHLANDVFEEQMISGEPIWYCHWEPGMEKPETRHVRPEYIWYQFNESAKYLSQLDWAVEYMPMSIGQLIQYLGQDLTGDQLDHIRSMQPQYSQDAYHRMNLDRFPDGSSFATTAKYDYLYTHIVDVYKVFWKEQTTVYALYSNNDNDTPYFSSKPPFVKFITAEEAKQLQSTAEKRERLKRKGQSIKKAYRVDLWSGIRVGARGAHGEYLKIAPVDFQYRTEYCLSDVPLPYIGYANNKFHQSYSPVWETKDIQELYNILHYQEELLIALSGVKGIMYDLSQMPTGMSPQELMYYMKQGIGLIETISPNGKPKRTSFNQFSTYDMTVSPAIGTITQVKQSLIELVGEITGATRQSTGQVAHTDQVGTTQMAIQQSDVVTEYYFQKHEELIEQLFTRLTNIFPVAYAEGKKGAYVVGKERQEILNIQKGQLKGQFRTLVNSGAKEREIMSTAKQMAQMKFKQGAVSTSNLLDMLDIDTMFEMRSSLKKFEEETLAKNQQMQQQGIEQQKQAQMELKQMEQQAAAQVQQASAQIQMQLMQMQGQIDMQREQLKMQTKAQEIAFETEKLKIDSEIDRYKIDKEAEVEKQYLQFEYTQLDANATNQRAQLLIGRAKMQIDLNKSRSKVKIKD